jgi:hypothetical protein
MSEKLTKEQIQGEYANVCARLGDKVFKFFQPLIEAHELCGRLLFLGREMAKCQEEELAARQKEESPIKLV